MFKVGDRVRSKAKSIPGAGYKTVVTKIQGEEIWGKWENIKTGKILSGYLREDMVEIDPEGFIKIDDF